MNIASSSERRERQAAAGRFLRVIHTRVFPAGADGGNPCPVVPFADGLSDGEMQDLARRFGLDTVFILNPRSELADMRLRYFVPDHEMGVSGHATIAAVTVRLLDRMLKSDHLRIETLTGLFDVGVAPHGKSTLVTLEQNAPIFGPIVPPDQVARVLKIEPSQIVVKNSPVQAVSVSRAKLLVPLRNWEVLDSLKPDFAALWDLCDAYQVTGLYPFTRETNKSNADAEARQFPLRAGFPEDAATGVAAAALGAYLTAYDLQFRDGHHEFRIAQGYAMGAPSLIQAITDCAASKITRAAVCGIARIVRRENVRREEESARQRADR